MCSDHSIELNHQNRELSEGGLFFFPSRLWNRGSAPTFPRGMWTAFCDHLGIFNSFPARQKPSTWSSAVSTHSCGIWPFVECWQYHQEGWASPLRPELCRRGPVENTVLRHFVSVHWIAKVWAPPPPSSLQAFVPKNAFPCSAAAETQNFWHGLKMTSAEAQFPEWPSIGADDP